jgi:DNA invertase Pin-like site-specific DNA recombinase
VTAWSYLVVSSDAQADTLPFQEQWATETAKAHGWKITRTFRSVSSGKAGTRKLLEQLLAELRSLPKGDRPDRILMVRLDRAGRGLALEAIAALAEIVKLGVTVHTRQDGDVKIERVVDSLRPIMEIVAGAFENEARRDKMMAVNARRRAAGLPTSTRPPFGLLRRAGDGAFVVDPETAWIVTAADAKLLAGEPVGRVALWAKDLHPRAWQTASGFRHMMRRESYVAAGLRAPQTQARLRERVEHEQARFGQMRTFAHEFTGVFACGLCVELGYEAEASIMHATTSRSRTGEPVQSLVCARHVSSKRGQTVATDFRHQRWMVASCRISDLWVDTLDIIAKSDLIQAWSRREIAHEDERRRGLLASIAALDQDAARLKNRRESALALFDRLNGGAVAQVQRILDDVDVEEREIERKRGAVDVELSRAPALPIRDPDRARRALVAARKIYKRLSAEKRGEANRRLCLAIGSHPILERVGRTRWEPVRLRWPEFDL